ncbi:MAG: class II fumarate hydratase [Rhodanobacteraceae bacterium]|nr:class II fumarate hydratase [Rhodanobacteraceae bacterium]
MDKIRIEHDSLGELALPCDALWGIQTQRAIDNFPVSGWRMPRALLRALGLIKGACADANAGLGALPKAKAKAIHKAALRVAMGEFDDAFPVDVFQTGSGTSSNMNANEVIAHVAAQALGRPVHPNDDVNCAQSSNDVIPSCIQIAAVLEVGERLLPALKHLRRTIERRARELATVAKTGRTHLMDAMPLRFDQELGAWATQLAEVDARLGDVSKRLRVLPIGGTAIGTGINAPKRFGAAVCVALKSQTSIGFTPHRDRFYGIATQDAALELSGVLRTAAIALTKIANDLRWMNSGPLAGLGEIELPALQPGSSIMPGKVNPVIPESVAMVAAQVIGFDATIAFAAASGNFQLNVMLPVIAWNLLTSIELLTNAATLLADKAIAGFTIRQTRIDDALARNPILVTALNPLIGYERAATIAKRAYREGRPVLDIAVEETGWPRTRLQKLLDPRTLTRGGSTAGTAGG